MSTIKEPTFRELAERGAIKSTCVVGHRGGFSVTVRCGDGESALATSRGDVRLFASLNTLATFLRNVGIAKFEVDTVDYEPGRLRKARPDRADALRRTRSKPQQSSLL